MFESDNEYYIWAAGTFGRRIVDFLRKTAPNLNIVAFIDSDKKRHGTIYHDLPIISWEEARPSIPRIKIIISLALPTQVRSFLLDHGYQENDDFFSAVAFIPRYFWTVEKKIIPANVLVITNNSCTCNCDGCGAYIPYVKKPFLCSLEDLSNTANLMFKYFDQCMNIGICGGEPLLNKNVADFCAYLRENYGEKFGTMSLVTNGIVIPTDEEMKKFAFAGTELSLSDYTKTNRSAARNLPLLMEKCQEFGVRFFLNRQSNRELWYDFGNPYEINITDPEELKLRFNKCFKPQASCLNGKLFACQTQHRRWLATERSEPHGEDSFDLNQDVTDQTREELYKIITHQPKLGYLTGCAHCGGTFTPYLK